ncbi:MAG: tRNA 2-thiouridine(34) synthase MnmA [Clostridia bacterium]|nr:tRNA 2-thiouridine(34) synthase MnmA [Clostridia bacterium]
MEDLSEVYNELIMEHSMNSYNKKSLSCADFCELGHNPNCGDEITLEVKLNGNIIEDMAFHGHGCAISQASTSIMIDTLKGKTVDEAREIVKTFIEMIKREITDEEELKKLEDAIAFKNISNMPARVKCALLAWHTLEEIFAKMDNMKNKKVLLGMSGGVDSSVSALLLKKQGYEVVGATLELFAGSSCCNISTYIDAKNVCSSIGIPHFTYDYKGEFKKYVIDDFINCYANCKTPNPCIECNKYMKFGLMYEKAKELGCNYIATGHYAKTEYSEEYGRWVLKKSKAGRKDQSYVLWNIPKELIEHVLFPLADFESKDEIRKIAKENNLKVANKPDSEDICFIPNGNYKEFLENNSNIQPKQGNIVNSKGEVLGVHTGLYNYTILQRKGLGISYKVPLFVIGFNMEANEVIVGEENELYRDRILVGDINLLLVDEITMPMEVEVKTRYSAKVAKAVITQKGDKIEVVFENPQRAITPGQSAVFYVGDIVLGGGKIEK